MKTLDEFGGKFTERDRLSEPLRVYAATYGDNKPIWRIDGYTLMDGRERRITKQCPRNDGDGGKSYKRALDIKSDIEAERDRLRGHTCPMVKRFTTLTDQQLRTYEGIQSLLEAHKRNNPTKVFEVGLTHLHDDINSPALETVCDSFVRSREESYEKSATRKGDLHCARHTAKIIKATFPGITLHQFVSEDIIQPLPPPPPMTERACAAAFGVPLAKIKAWRGREKERAPAWPTLVYADAAWVWNPTESARFCEWLVEMGCTLDLEVPFPPVVAPPPKPKPDPRSRIVAFCELLLRRGRKGKLPGAMPDLRTMQDRLERVMHLLSFAVARKWLDKVPTIPPYMKHDDRPVAEAQTLSPTQTELYMRTVENLFPEFACRESIKAFEFIRPDGEISRLAAWIDPNTTKLLPALTGKKKRKPSPEAVVFWPAFRHVRVRGAELLSAGMLYIDATVSKVNFPRRVYLPPNGALWIAVYRSLWRLGEWDLEERETVPPTFDALADKCYRPTPAPGALRETLRFLLPLDSDILRHGGISYFCALHEQNMEAAANQAGNSVQEIKQSYFDIREYEEAVAHSRILPTGWRWGKKGAGFVPPAGWSAPSDWVLPLEIEAEDCGVSQD